MKITIKYFANTKIKGKVIGKQTFYPLYIIIIMRCKTTQVKSNTNYWVTEKGVQEYNETGKTSAKNVYDLLQFKEKDIEDRTKYFGKLLDTEKEFIYNILKLYNKLYDDIFNISKYDLTDLINKISCDISWFISPYLWELTGGVIANHEYTYIINTSLSYELITNTLNIKDKPLKGKEKEFEEIMQCWKFVSTLSTEQSVLEWYFTDYKRIINKNEMFDKCLDNALHAIFEPKIMANVFLTLLDDNKTDVK